MKCLVDDSLIDKRRIAVGEEPLLASECRDGFAEVFAQSSVVPQPTQVLTEMIVCIHRSAGLLHNV